MSHVTPLAQLEMQIARLRTIRTSRIHKAEDEIRQANRDFDREALPLGRKIQRLREEREAELAEQEEPTQRQTRAPKTLHLEGLTAEEADHYKELARRGG